jgi:large subunit ribosomal protein L31
MKKDIHPKYRPVVFWDTQSNFKFVTSSTVETRENTVWEDGNTYPLVKIEVSSASHPFYTGNKQNRFANAGQVDKFNKKYIKPGSSKPDTEVEA